MRRGSKACHVVFYKEIEVAAADRDSDDVATRLFARATPVFSADHVDGLPETPPAASVPTLDDVESFVTAARAVIRHGGDQACYIPKLDEIRLPVRSAFRDLASYYATLLHELTHWTAPKQRCDRDLIGRFGSAAYTMEEFVAELGAAFLCADLGIASEPRPDHAQYLAHWLEVLKTDKRGIFTAASKASLAADFLAGLGGG